MIAFTIITFLLLTILYIKHLPEIFTTSEGVYLQYRIGFDEEIETKLIFKFVKKD